MSKGTFRFKQFTIDQDQCAMKVGTDGFLLGALSPLNNPQRILDIGTGTGLVALMLAQQTTALVDALEIDQQAAVQANANFKASPWSDRMNLIPQAFEDFKTDERYDLIVSNPPYFIQAYISPNQQRNTARHAENDFLGVWMYKIRDLLNGKGRMSFIVPYDLYAKIVGHAQLVGLYQQQCIAIKSFEKDVPKRVIVVFGKEEEESLYNDFIIYEKVNSYTAGYKELAKPFFLYF